MTADGASAQLRLVAVISLWLVLVPAALVAVRTWLPSDGLPVVEASGSYVDGALRVAPPHPVSGIVDGDLVASVDGLPINTMLGDPTARVVVTGDERQLTVERDGRRWSTSVAIEGPRRFGPLLADLWPLLLSTSLVLGLAVLLVSRRPREPVAHALLLLSASLVSLPLNALAYLEPLDLWGRPWVVAWSMLGLAGFMELAVGLVMFALSFPRGRPHPQLAKTVRVAAVIPIVLVSLVSALYLAGGWSIPRNNVADMFAGIWWLLGLIATLALLSYRGWSLRRDPVARRQTQIVLLGAAGSLVPWIVGNFLPGDPPVIFFALIILPFAASIAFAVLRTNLLELDLVLNRALVAAITASTLLAIYAGIVAGTTLLVDDSGPFVTLPAAGVIALLFGPVHGRSQRWVAQRLFGLAAEPGVVFDRLGERLTSAADPDALLVAVVDTVTEALRLPYAAIELCLEGSARVVHQRGHPTGVVASIDLRLDEEVLGRLLVSPRPDEGKLSPADSALLTNLGRHAAVAARVGHLTHTLRDTQLQLVISRETERDRIQHDLHDRVGPALFGLALQLSGLADGAEPPLRKTLEKLQGEASETLEDVRRLARDLRPSALEEIGLSAALSAAATRLNASGTFTFDVDVPLVLPRFAPHDEDAIYVVFLEAMTNAVRHSGGHRGSIRLAVERPQEVTGEIADDGVGVPDPRPDGMGLRSMAQRIEAAGGEFAIETGTSGGAVVRFRIPTEVVLA